MTDAPPPYDEEVDTILDNFGFSIANNREESRTALKRKPKAQLQALLLRAQIAELEDTQLHEYHKQIYHTPQGDWDKATTQEERLAALHQQLKEVERKDK